MQPDYSPKNLFSYIGFDPDPSHAAKRYPGTGLYDRTCSTRTWHGPSASWIKTGVSLLGISLYGKSTPYSDTSLIPENDYSTNIDREISKSFIVKKVETSYRNFGSYQYSRTYINKYQEHQTYRDKVSVADMYIHISKVLGEPSSAANINCSNEIDIKYNKYPFPICMFATGYDIKVYYGYYSVSKSRSCT